MPSFCSRIAQLILLLLMLGSLTFAGINAWSLYRSPLGTILVERSEDEISARVEHLLAREATSASIGKRMNQLLAETPHNWAAIDAVERLATEQGMPIPLDVHTALAQARARERGWYATAGKCMACARNSTNCDLSAIAFCQAAISLTPGGDLVSIVRELTNYGRGLPFDEIELFLSLVGVGAFALVPATGGSSLAVKAGAGLTKTAYRIGALADPMVAAARVALVEGVDWRMVRQARLSNVREDITRAVNPAVIRPATDLLESAHEMRRASGLVGGLFLIGKVDDVVEAQRMALVARAAGPSAPGAVELLGKSRLLRLTMRFADEVYAAIAGLIGAILALFGLVFALIKSSILRLLQRLARRRG